MHTMHTLEKCKYRGDALKIAINISVLEYRTAEEQIKLMKALKDCKAEASNIALSLDILKKMNVAEQIQLMKSQRINEKKVELTHSDNLNKINDLKELKKYVCNLQKVYGNDTDIKIKDVVKLYK